MIELARALLLAKPSPLTGLLTPLEQPMSTSSCTMNASAMALPALALALLAGCAPEATSTVDGVDASLTAEQGPDAGTSGLVGAEQLTGADLGQTVLVSVDVYDGMGQKVPQGALCSVVECIQIIQGRVRLQAPVGRAVRMRSAAPSLVTTIFELDTTDTTKSLVVAEPSWLQVVQMNEFFGVERVADTSMMLVKIESLEGTEVSIDDPEAAGPFYLDKDGVPLLDVDVTPGGEAYAYFTNIQEGPHMLIAGSQGLPCKNGHSANPENPVQARQVLIAPNAMFVPRPIRCSAQG